jgi:high-affinity iron transporter
MRVLLGVLVVGAVLMALPEGTLAGDAAQGQAIYDSRCAFCHGSTGNGDGPAGAALNPRPVAFAGADYWKAANLETMRGVIKNGKPGTAMVPFGTTLSDTEIDNVLATLQGFAKK